MNGNVADYLLAHRESGAPALLAGTETISHRELGRQVDAAAAGLIAGGTAPGAIVALVGENSIRWVVGYLAILRAGAAAMPVPAGDSSRVLRGALALSGVTRVLCPPRHLARVLEARPAGLPVLLDPAGETTAEGVTPLAGGAAPPPDGRPAGGWPPVDAARDLAQIMLTSGTTGDPKGVRVSHRNVAANTEAILAYLGLRADDRMMVVLPFHYCFGLSLLHTHLRAGGSVVLNNRFMFPDRVLDEIAEKQCTGFAGVPSTYQILLRKSHLRQKPLGSLRHVQQAGGRLAVPLLEELRAVLPAHTRVFVMYGATEATARMSYLPPERLRDKLGSIGVPVSGVSFELCDAAGRPVPPGEVGEIVASGASVTLGYHDDPQLTAARFRDGRYFTGDLARVDAEGFYFVESRKADFIKSFGFRISPREIEDAILELPEVLEVLVAGVPDEEAGEAVAAYVVPAPGHDVTKERIVQHCLARLPNQKVPTVVRLGESLPKTEAGKLARAELLRTRLG